ncbi:MAG: hypothetical protein OXC92_00075 [Flavobacteriaceae bacterium]|nr:hypothetical protein [Flavobacteriaceae bacterium]MCY4215365.1 hypothetical protein [Flavobacteriaceae bacterium]MCY4253469.1 hypothetical protein [Flavobacteriaceae bacterium]
MCYLPKIEAFYFIASTGNGLVKTFLTLMGIFWGIISGIPLENFGSGLARYISGNDLEVKSMVKRSENRRESETL